MSENFWHPTILMACPKNRHWFYICRVCKYHSQCWRGLKDAKVKEKEHLDWCPGTKLGREVKPNG